ncbi:MAG: OadG family protein [Clostridia bacterium]|nr:OadG family protein [Clostridia bacterium]
MIHNTLWSISLAQSIGLGDAGIIGIVGIVLVMLVIGLLMYIVKLLSCIVRKVENGRESAVKAIQSKGQVELTNVSEEDAALIMAIVADRSSVPLNHIKFVSIKLLEENK